MLPLNVSLLARAFVVLWFAVGGVGHFMATDFFVGITPPWVPYPTEVIWASGVLELMGAAGLLIPSTRRLAAAGLFVLTLAVTPANIHMVMHPDLFPQFPLALLYVRLVVQVFLLVCIVKAAGLDCVGSSPAGDRSPCPSPKASKP
ncbi:DoxX family protein [Limnobacter humi]|uniref:DoxX family protein n=1 Tax=Limnobacter humi TaxID=1778671 RepID=A0ABT1WGF6_9BURK|nr:DoxX family protein [Limnobacter humi]MCQ8896474.1 DoxX family protein [Limnobacter humi]